MLYSLHLSELLGTSVVTGYIATFYLLSYKPVIWGPWPPNITCVIHIFTTNTMYVEDCIAQGRKRRV